MVEAIGRGEVGGKDVGESTVYVREASHQDARTEVSDLHMVDFDIGLWGWHRFVSQDRYIAEARASGDMAARSFP